VRHGSGYAVPARFCEGDTVDVLNASRLPQVEEVRHTGTVIRVQESGAETLYWVSGLPCARVAKVLRLVRRAR
jgi:hypothetical protein